LALDLPADFFDGCFAVPHLILRVSRFSVIDGEDETVARLVPHTDSGFMTLLPPNPAPGLSILLPNGRWWIDAPGAEGAYVINGGNILHRCSNERFL
jgi:isopenicillin N synthase-like dioxygenase